MRISLRRAAILADGGGAADGSSEPANVRLPAISEGSMRHSKLARSLVEALSSLEQVQRLCWLPRPHALVL